MHTRRENFGAILASWSGVTVTAVLSHVSTIVSIGAGLLSAYFTIKSIQKMDAGKSQKKENE